MLFITSIFISHCFGTVVSQAKAYANHTYPPPPPKKKAEKDPSAGADQGRRPPPLILGKTGPNKMTPSPLAQGWI